MQYHRIRLNMAFSSSTVPFNTELRNFNNYYVYGNTLGGGIVTRFNVRSFLNDNKNQVIINDFISYLSGTTTSDELVKILGDDEQLATIFNQFYETTIMVGVQTSSAVVAKTMLNVSGITFQETYSNWNGTSNSLGLENIPMSINGSSRSNDVKFIRSRFSFDDGYFIPVFIQESYEEMTKYSYDSCPTKISLLLKPELSNNTTTIETEAIDAKASDSAIKVSNDLVTRLATQPLDIRFIITSNELVNRCYNSQCIDNRYCDLLYFANQRITQLNAIDTEYIRGLLGAEPALLTDKMVMDILINEMIKQGQPVVFPIFSCMFE